MLCNKMLNLLQAVMVTAMTVTAPMTMAVLMPVAVLMLVAMLMLMAVLMLVTMLMSVAMLTLVTMLMSVAMLMLMTMLISVAMLVLVTVLMSMSFMPVAALLLLAAYQHREMCPTDATFDCTISSHAHTGNAEVIELIHKRLGIGQQLQKRCCKHVSRCSHPTVQI